MKLPWKRLGLHAQLSLISHVLWWNAAVLGEIYVYTYFLRLTNGYFETSLVLLWRNLLVPVGFLIGGWLARRSSVGWTYRTGIILYFVFFRRRKIRDKRPSGTGYEVDVYAGMCDLARQVNLGPLPSQTPLEYCARLISEFPLEKDSIQYILDVFLARRYRPESSSDHSESMTWRLMKARRSIFDAIRDRLKERGKR